MARDDGFTLLELIIVLAVIALVLGAVVNWVPSGPTHTHVRAAAKQVAAGLRLARSEAIRGNHMALFTIDVENRTIRVGDQTTATLSSGIALSLSTAAVELEAGNAGGIRFFPDGSSSGGRIGLKRLNDTAAPMTVSVDWLTGLVSVAE